MGNKIMRTEKKLMDDRAPHIRLEVSPVYV